MFAVMIRGLIFDCDGTLVDTMPLHWMAWQNVCGRHGIHFEEKRFYELGGVGSIQIFKLLLAEQGLAGDPFELSREKEAGFLPLAGQAQGIEPVLAIAREFHGKLPMGVATGGKRVNCTAILKSVGIYDWFDAIVTSEDVENQKPAPDIFLKAAAQIGIPPQECRAYEDTDLGMQAIRAAGMEAVDIRDLLQARGEPSLQDSKSR
jgi:beta-phosphoglucomutase family hydrolase